MVKINLKDYYPIYERDAFMEVHDELAAQFRQWQRNEATYQRKKRRYHVYYSLEHTKPHYYETLFLSDSPCDVYKHKLSREQLRMALSRLPSKQARRIYKHYIIGMSQAAIARAERVSRNTVSSSIRQGLASRQINLNKFSKRG